MAFSGLDLGCGREGLIGSHDAASVGGEGAERSYRVGMRVVGLQKHRNCVVKGESRWEQRNNALLIYFWGGLMPSVMVKPPISQVPNGDNSFIFLKRS